jgi:hypothetical protein
MEGRLRLIMAVGAALMVIGVRLLAKHIWKERK